MYIYGIYIIYYILYSLSLFCSRSPSNKPKPIMYSSIVSLYFKWVQFHYKSEKERNGPFRVWYPLKWSSVATLEPSPLNKLWWYRITSKNSSSNHVAQFLQPLTSIPAINIGYFKVNIMSNTCSCMSCVLETAGFKRDTYELASLIRWDCAT